LVAFLRRHDGPGRPLGMRPLAAAVACRRNLGATAIRMARFSVTSARRVVSVVEERSRATRPGPDDDRQDGSTPIPAAPERDRAPPLPAHTPHRISTRDD